MRKVVGIRGSNGSGKSWVMRRIMDAAESTFKLKHKLSNGVLVNVYEKVVIPGSYDKPTGGCDTISKPQLVWDTIMECAQYNNVAFEGVIVGNVFEPTMLLIERLEEIGVEFVPICLSTSFEQCVANVNARRAEAGKEPMAEVENIMTNHKKNLSSAKKLHEAKKKPYWVSSEEAVQIALKELDYAE